jgi:hypothetical protein
VHPRVRLLDLVEEHDARGILGERARELSALLVPTNPAASRSGARARGERVLAAVDRTSERAPSKSSRASVSASSVLPVPVRPRKRRLASGRPGARARAARRTARTTAATAASCPTTARARRRSMPRDFHRSRSSSSRRARGDVRVGSDRGSAAAGRSRTVSERFDRGRVRSGSTWGRARRRARGHESFGNARSRLDPPRLRRAASDSILPCPPKPTSRSSPCSSTAAISRASARRSSSPSSSAARASTGSSSTGSAGSRRRSRACAARARARSPRSPGYEILGRLGAGGTADVFRAREKKTGTCSRSRS